MSIVNILLLVFSCWMTTVQPVYSPSENFTIDVFRKTYKEKENLIEGDLYINNEFIGKTYERIDLQIKAGAYPGYLRYVSAKGFVAGPFGEVGQTGDFLLEIGEVYWSDGRKRKHLLFHGGNKAEHSRGCIMLGGVPKDKDGKPYHPDNHPLRILRLKFYGTDTPNATPNKNIIITISDKK